jgi:hypothetical protein
MSDFGGILILLVNTIFDRANLFLTCLSENCFLNLLYLCEKIKEIYGVSAL